MADQDPLSDDISALWGPSDSEILRPAPLEPLSASVDRQNGRLDALEGDVQRINRSIRSLKAGDPEILRAELGRRQDEAISAVRAEQARVEERLTQRLTELAQRVAELAARAGVVTGQVYGLEDRTSEQQAAQDAAARDAEATTTPASTTTPAANGVESRLAAVEARLEVGLDSLARRMEELVGRMSGLHGASADPTGPAEAPNGADGPVVDDHATVGAFDSDEGPHARSDAPEEVDAPVG